MIKDLLVLLGVTIFSLVNLLPFLKVPFLKFLMPKRKETLNIVLDFVAKLFVKELSLQILFISLFIHLITKITIKQTAITLLCS